MRKFDIVHSQNADIDEINKLSMCKRMSYEKIQNIFWRWGGELGEREQKKWFKKLFVCDRHICLTAKHIDKVKGFIIGKIISAPEVYNPGGLTLLIDDFCVSDNNWQEIGTALVIRIKSIAKSKGVIQLIVVSGHHDSNKKLFLEQMNLRCASEWFVGSSL